MIKNLMTDRSVIIYFLFNTLSSKTGLGTEKRIIRNKTAAYFDRIQYAAFHNLSCSIHKK